MMGTREISGSDMTKLRNRTMTAWESMSPSSMLISIMLAPLSTCCRGNCRAPSRSFSE